ncbi:MAG: cell division protein FtsA [Fimbriimonas sp.]
MKNDLLTVLDLGATKVTCLAATADGSDGMKIEALATTPCKGIRRGVIADMDETATAIDAVVRRVQADLSTDIQGVIVGVSGTHIEGVNAQGFKPIVPRSRLITHQDVLEVINHSRALVLPPDREQIQALPREFRVDGQRDVRKPIGMNGSKLEVVTYIVTGQTTAIQNLEKAINRSGKKVEQMVLKPLASGIGVLTPEELELGTIVVDIGGGTTDLAIFVSGSLAYTASLPIGASHVTGDISKLLKTSPEEAENLKLTYGNAVGRLVSDKESVDVQQIGQPVARPLQRRVLCEIIESRMRELAVMVRQHVEKSGLMGTLPGGMVLTGGGAQLAGTDKLFDEVLKHMRVRVAEPDLDSRFPSQPGLGTAVGLARYGLQCQDDITPASGAGGWKERVRGLFSLLGGR